MPRRRHKKDRTKNQDSNESGPYIVKQSDVMGRYLVAGQDLAEGEVIVSEPALVVGPIQDSQPVCLGCYSLSPTDRCGKCLWPLCSNRCKGLNKRHGHSKEECSVLAACSYDSTTLPRNQLYNAVVPLRCLLLKTHHPQEWKTLLTMEAHNDIRRKIPSIWEYNEKTVVNRIRTDWNITEYSEEEIHTVCGILEVNSYSVGGEPQNLRALYPVGSLIAHSCVTNTSHSDDDDYNIKVITSVPILHNDLITLSYTNSIQGTKKRREDLKQSKFFDCECGRCKDPTELGTYLSSVKCGKCDSGHLLPADPLTAEADWICDNKKCRTTLPASTVNTLLDRVEHELKSVDNNSIEELESSIRRYKNILHKNHYHILGMKYALSQLYGKSVGFLIHEMSEVMLERKKQICEEVLALFDIIEPGLSHIRGLTMYELHAPIMVLAIKKLEKRQITKEDFSRKLRKVAYYLKECIKIFKFEKRKSQEASIRDAAHYALAQLQSWQPVIGKI